MPALRAIHGYNCLKRDESLSDSGHEGNIPRGAHYQARHCRKQRVLSSASKAVVTAHSVPGFLPWPSIPI